MLNLPCEIMALYSLRMKIHLSPSPCPPPIGGEGQGEGVFSPVTSITTAFAPYFSEPVWQQAQVLLIGAILAPGRRTVASALCVMG